MRSPDEVRRLNEAAGRRGASAWAENAEAEASRILGIRRHDAQVDPVRIESWASHPDERVRCALLRSTLAWGDARRDIGRMIMEADAAARDGDEFWNPTLDALATAAFATWPVEGGFVRDGNALRYPEGQGPVAWVRTHVAPHLRSMAPTADEARALIEAFTCPEVVRLVLENVSADAAFVRWLGAFHPNLVHRLIARASPCSEVDSALWEHALERLEKRAAGGDPSRIVAALAERGALPEDALERLLRIADGVPLATWELAEAIRHFMRPGNDAFTADRLRRYYRVVFRSKDLVMSIARHAAATDELRAHIAEHTPFGNIRVDIARLYNDAPIVRAAFRTSTAKRVLWHLAQRTAEEELEEIADRLSNRHPEDAMRVTEQRMAAGALSATRARAMLRRYFERLIERNPIRAQQEAGRVLARLGERTLPVEWARALGRGLAECHPTGLMQLGEDAIAHLRREDWEGLLAGPRASKPATRTDVVRLLRTIPSARQDPDAQRFVFEHGDASDVKSLLASVLPGVEHAAAQGVIRACWWEFDAVLNEHPALKAALTTDDLVPLLESLHGQTRQKAILLLGDVTNAANVRREIESGPIRRDPSR